MAITTKMKKIGQGQLSPTSDRAIGPKSCRWKPRRALHLQMLRPRPQPRRATRCDGFPALRRVVSGLFRSARRGRGWNPRGAPSRRERWPRKCSMTRQGSRSCRAIASRNRTRRNLEMANARATKSRAPTLESWPFRRQTAFGTALAQWADQRPRRPNVDSTSSKATTHLV